MLTMHALPPYCLLQELALARTERLPLGAQISTMGKQLLTHRRMHEGMVSNAAAVLQRVWRHRQRQRQLMRAEAAEDDEEGRVYAVRGAVNPAPQPWQHAAPSSCLMLLSDLCPFLDCGLIPGARVVLEETSDTIL